MGVYLGKRADHVKLYLALWLVAFLGLWVNFFREFSEPFRVPTISYFLAFLTTALGAYFILAPLLQGRAITAEKSRWLPFLPALLLLLHWLFRQLDVMFAPGGSVVLFSFSLLVDPLFLLFLFLGLALHLLAAQPQIMDAVFVGMKNTVRLFVAFAFLALGPILLAQVIQAVSALARIGVDVGAWSNYARLGDLESGGLVLSLLLDLLLLIVPLCGWVLLQKLLGKATPKWDRLLRLPWRWLAALPLFLIALAALVQPATFLQPWFVITAVFSLLSILVNFLAASQNPAAMGIVKLAESFFFYPLRYFRKLSRFAKKDLEVTESETPGIDYFCQAVQGFICVAILAFWVALALHPLCRFYGLDLLRLPLRPEFFPLGTFQGLLAYPLVFFVYPPVYALLVTLFYEVAVAVLQILVRLGQFLGRLLERK